MSCADVRNRLVDLLYAELREEDRAVLSAHLEHCAECRAAWLELRSVSSALDRWTVAAPEAIAERVLATLAIREAEAARAQRPAMSVQHFLGFLLAGAAATAVSLLLVGSTHPEDTPLKLGLVGVLWTALYSGATFLTQHGRYRGLALAALLAAGLSVLFAPVLSMPAVIEACRRWLEAAQASVAPNGVIVLAGAVYAATPVFLASATVTRVWRGRILSDAVNLAGIYGLLLAPSVYLQCHPLALSLIAPWVAGVVLGSFLGSAAGVSVASRLRPVSA